MKSIVLLILLLISSPLFSQISEGYIQYTIEVEAIDTSMETKQSVGLLLNSKMEIYFDQAHLRVDFKLGKMSQTQMILDFNKDSVVTLAKSVYGTFATVSTIEELSYLQKEESSSIQLIDETKTFLGYTCKKAIVSSKGIETVYWYSDQIKVEFKGNEFFDKKLPGFPLFFSKTENGVYMQYQVSNVVTELKDVNKVFDLTIPTEYSLMPK